MLASTLFFATVASTFFTAGSALTVAQPQNLVQCQNATLGWTTGTGPYTVKVYTGCNDDNEDPIATVTGLTAPTCQWYVNAVSGTTIMYEVIDSAGKEWWSDDAYVGGDANDAATCASHIKAAKLTVETSDASAKPDTSETTTGVVPTTASAAPTASSAAGLGGVANAASDDGSSSTTSAKAVASAKAIGAVSGAGANAAPSTQLALGLLGAAFLAML